LAAGLSVLVVQAGCGLDDVKIPELDGPSALATSLKLNVNRDVLVADGRDSAVVTATVRGPNGQPAANRDVFFAIADESGRFADIGVIISSNGPGTGATVRTNAQGVAQVLYEAPPRTDATANQTVLVMARVVGNDANGQFYQSVRIELRSAQPRLFPPNPGNKPPTCQFIVEGQLLSNTVISFQTTSFDSDGTIVRYQWEFGDNTGIVYDPDVPHVYRSAGSYTVTHTVTDDDGGQAACATLLVLPR
jgi:hypothetical protein